MLLKTKGVVLHYIKYTESSVIATIFTQEYGKQAFIIQGIRSKKSNHKINILQPLYLLDIEANFKPGRNIQRIKEIKLFYPFSTIPFDIKKNTISIFIAELLFKTLPEEVADEDLFNFITSAILKFDKIKERVSDFHIHFLIKYIQLSGFSPKFNFSAQNKYFDLHSGQFIESKTHDKILNEDESKLFYKILNSEVFLPQNITINNNVRNSFLDNILEYLYWHFEGLKTLKSVKVLKEIFY